VSDTRPRATLVTAPTPGAVGLIQIVGVGATRVLARITRIYDWPIGRMRLADLADVDRGFAVALRDDWVQVMPHAGPRVVQRLLDAMASSGATYECDPPARDVYPEAASDLEADMLATIARAASPAAVDLLLAQPALWRAALTCEETMDCKAIVDASRRLDRLIEPPTVVVVGHPNVGKSTLTNRMVGRSASVVADLPGTTRDWVAGLVELSADESPHAAVAVRWLDTPGLRTSDDTIEQDAIRAAREVIATADVLIAMRDPQIDWPDSDALPRDADMRVINKCDRMEHASAADGLGISAVTGDGVDELARRILVALGLDEGGGSGLWAFSPTLKQVVATGDVSPLEAYLHASAASPSSDVQRIE